MERIIKITGIATTTNSKRGTLKPGIYKELNLDGNSLLVVVGEDGTWDCLPYSLIEPFLNITASTIEKDHKHPMTLNEIAASEEETQDSVPAWFVLELIKAIK